MIAGIDGVRQGGTPADGQYTISGGMGGVPPNAGDRFGGGVSFQPLSSAFDDTPSTSMAQRYGPYSASGDERLGVHLAPPYPPPQGGFPERAFVGAYDAQAGGPPPSIPEA